MCVLVCMYVYVCARHKIFSLIWKIFGYNFILLCICFFFFLCLKFIFRNLINNFMVVNSYGGCQLLAFFYKGLRAINQKNHQLQYSADNHTPTHTYTTLFGFIFLTLSLSKNFKHSFFMLHRLFLLSLMEKHWT